MQEVKEKQKSNSTTPDNFFTILPTARIDTLREHYMNLKPTASIDRARIETRILKETEWECTVIKRGSSIPLILLVLTWAAN